MIFLGNGFCLQNQNFLYNPSFSSTYKNDKYTTYFSPLFANATQSKDNFIFYDDLNLTQNISVDQTDFIYTFASDDIFDIIYPDLICRYFGLQFTYSSDNLEYNSLINQLKTRNKIKNKYCSIMFYDNEKDKINNYDGILV